jgi:hypothetical protein
MTCRRTPSPVCHGRWGRSCASTALLPLQWRLDSCAPSVSSRHFVVPALSMLSMAPAARRRRQRILAALSWRSQQTRLSSKGRDNSSKSAHSRASTVSPMSMGRAAAFPHPGGAMSDASDRRQSRALHLPSIWRTPPRRIHTADHVSRNSAKNSLLVSRRFVSPSSNAPWQNVSTAWRFLSMPCA